MAALRLSTVETNRQSVPVLREVCDVTLPPADADSAHMVLIAWVHAD